MHVTVSHSVCSSLGAGMIEGECDDCMNNSSQIAIFLNHQCLSRAVCRQEIIVLNCLRLSQAV